MLSVVLALLTGIAVLGADQYTKYFISTNFQLGEGTDFLKGFIDIQYIHNTGGAWGILSGNTIILLLMTIFVMGLLIFFLIKVGNKSKLLFWAITLVVSGGIGNLIDRIFREGNVIDFLHFEFFPTFPVFNIADIAVVTGAGFLILYLILDTVKEIKKGKAQNG